MKSSKSGLSSIDEYIAAYPAPIQNKLEELRAAIREVAPEAQEKISYKMPTYYLHGNLVHFAAFKNHIGFYPTPSGIEAYKDELLKYEGSKGAVRFPIDKPLPLGLIKKIVQSRVDENRRNAEQKAHKKKKP